ncbi:hypothetical protein JJB11_12310 [Ramlibacter ginsenosidimutans]|uniref:Uncharacterized protein n=1 Tax=Ramlibacter ginsenosidimutans TaxID=502333 RepID=A0A934WMQ7_9BURK|nr:hypothetical protein [Ramlibacter ginsenosidimutans]MBK6006875.1 hypothetical protein [Ramlibacter ginsenosidimutans]
MFQYIVRVRDKTYVWGSSDLESAFPLPLVLVVNNDAFGDAVQIASESPQGVPTVLGMLQPGQCWTLVLTGLRGVTATCATDSTLACAILFPSGTQG